jgi:hypothetical protein
MLLGIFFFLALFGVKPQIGIFILLFVLYLLIAMRNFYQQGYFKTFIKFMLLNFTYLLISAFGVVIVGLISFAVY